MQTDIDFLMESNPETQTLEMAATMMENYNAEQMMFHKDHWRRIGEIVFSKGQIVGGISEGYKMLRTLIQRSHWKSTDLPSAKTWVLQEAFKGIGGLDTLDEVWFK